ncbi:hypothetical protein ACFQE1_04800 [Halobium palmae]|uniref:UGSC-like domain-containing protein n=1 Tax=Halobium palmae TaxID=1776492 RepID=A0ABD5RY73_9EURY
MGLLDPQRSAESKERHPISARVDTLEEKHVGFYDNGKPAAEPVLEVIKQRLDERYDDITFSHFALDYLNQSKDPEKMKAVEEWASNGPDVCIGAMGDCGSCTKFLVWGIEAAERAGVPSVGILDEAFVNDWKSNAIERGWPLRYQTVPVRSEVTNVERIEGDLTPDVIDDIEGELTRPRNDKEQDVAAKS